MTPDDWISIGSYIVLDYPEYELALEECRNGDDQMVFIHLTVRTKWTKSLLQRFDREWALLRKHIPCPLYAHGDVDDDKYEKFLSLFGFEHLITAPLTDGTMRRIFWHQGNDPVQTIYAVEPTVYH